MPTSDFDDMIAAVQEDLGVSVTYKEVTARAALDSSAGTRTPTYTSHAVTAVPGRVRQFSGGGGEGSARMLIEEAEFTIGVDELGVVVPKAQDVIVDAAGASRVVVRAERAAMGRAYVVVTRVERKMK